MDLITLKILLGLGVLAAGALGGAVPLLRAEAGGTGRFLDRGSAFAAGVFLGTGLVHMLPAASDAWDALGVDYPMAYLLAALAVVGMLLFEHVLLPEVAHEALHAPADERFGGAGSGHGLAPYAILTGLSIHSLLAGLALGARSAPGGALVIFLALLAHKTTEGFALGVSLARGRLGRGHAVGLLGVFAVATPLGIAVGTVLGDALEARAGVVFEAAFLALAAGTFAYVATIDVLREEFRGPGGRLAKWSFVALGTALAALLAIWT